MARRHTYKTHRDAAGLSLCGVMGVTVAEGWTCALCKRRSDELAKQEAEARAEKERAEAARERPLLSPSMLASLRGPTPLPSLSARTLARSIDGEDRSDAPRWGSWRGALAAWASWRDEGVPLASTSSPDRFERGKARGGSVGSRVPPGTEHDLGDIGLAFDRACESVARETPFGANLRIVRLVAEARLCGVRVREKIPGRKTWRTVRQIPALRDLAPVASLTPHQASLITERVLLALDAQRVASVHVAKRVVPRFWDPRRKESA